jgi:hypothetical protein
MAGLTRIKSDGIGDNCDFDGEGTLVLDSTNNRVGIGTSSPGGNLTVTDASTYTVDVKTNGSDGALLTTLGGSASLALGTDSAERLRIDSVGNVSIGISTFTLPSGKGLQVYDSTTPRFKLANSTTGTGSGDGSLLYVSGNDFLIENKESANMRFYTSASERMRIDSAGRIGIASGSQDLSVFNANGAQDLVVYAKGSSGTNQHAGITLKAGSTSGQCSVTFADGTTGDNRYRGAIDYFHSNDSMGFRTGSVANRILITSDGRVCMGTTSATASRNLTLTGLTNDAGIQITGTTSGGNCYITNTPGSSGQTYIGNTNSQNLNFVVGGNVSSKMTINSSGYVTIGTTSNHHTAQTVIQGNTSGGANPLTVANSNTSAGQHYHIIMQRGASSIVGSIQTTLSATVYLTSSDYRLKENIVNITDGITRVKQLQPRRFNFIVDNTKVLDGFIAHEAQTVVPEAVSGEKDGEEMQGIDQSKFVPLLTAALQEAIAEIETLKTKVAALEAG